MLRAAEANLVSYPYEPKLPRARSIQMVRLVSGRWYYFDGVVGLQYLRIIPLFYNIQIRSLLRVR